MQGQLIFVMEILIHWKMSVNWDYATYPLWYIVYISYGNLEEWLFVHVDLYGVGIIQEYATKGTPENMACHLPFVRITLVPSGRLMLYYNTSLCMVLLNCVTA